jgi:flagellar secretion chaperone FliS
MTVPNPAMRERYLADSIATAPPAKLLVMLYDRLVLDLSRGEEALRAGDRVTASTHLIHAQDIVLELRTSLKLDAWEGANGLSQVYTFVLTELIHANMNGEAKRVSDCRGLIEELRDSWREAAMSVLTVAAS